MKLIKYVDHWVLGVAVLLSMISGVQAQTNTNQVVDASAQVKKLDVWVGDWTYEGMEGPNPLEKGGPFSGKLSNKWVLNNSFIESHWEEKNPTGNLEGVEIHGYDPLTKRFFYHGYSSDGGTMMGTGVHSQNTWAGTAKMIDKDGKAMMVRTVSRFTDENQSVAVTWDLSQDEGKTWTPWLNFTMKKAK